MSDFGDALGTAVEGGLLSKAVSRAKDEAADGAPLDHGHFSEGECLNCGTQLIGNHCHECGQKAHLHRTMGAFLHDLLHGALHFEGKTWKTLPMLFFKPGELTRRYIEGQRARFVSPMALFLFSIFLMFAVFQAVGLSAPTDIATKASLDKDMTELREKANLEVEEQRERVAAMSPDNKNYADAVARLERYEKDAEGLSEATKIVTGTDAAREVNIKGIGVPFIDKGLEKWKTNPGLMLYKLQTNSYKFSWLLIPLSIPFMSLLFLWRRKYKAYDHAIFVTYSIAFMSLLFIVISVLVKFGAPEWSWGLLVTFVPPLHIYKQLRGTYGLSRFSALWRLSMLSIFIFVVLSLFIQLLLILGAF
ncbi:MAG: DUF3667 domain-containing protein [Erythrobacter sp.]